MSAYTRLLRPLLFKLDAERAHNMGLWMVARGLVRARLVVDPRLRTRVAGLDFPNPIGLAAGLDKDGVALGRWACLGFGFAEIGTLTPRPQPGNPKPRLFRLIDDCAIVNRMGFNNHGAVAAAERMRGVHAGIPVGINLGKNKDTSLEDAPDDYRAGYQALEGIGDYFVVNVSSPNTPGLRSLQDVDSLTAIVRAMSATKPVFVKLAPDLTDEEIDELGDWAANSGIAGLIATNTTLARPGLRSGTVPDGGLSGRPLMPRSTQVLARLAERKRGLALFGVGGVFTAEDAVAKFRAGADLVQLYSGWIYGGPTTVPRILLGLLDECERLGAKSIAELRPR